VDHPHYDPDLMVHDFHPFWPPKKNLAGKQFATYANTKQGVTSCLHTPYADFCYSRIQALVPQWDKCLNMKGDNVEVWEAPSANHVPYA
jgi:hypothetical protein